MPERMPLEAYVASLRDIPWRQSPAVTPEAEALIEEHIARMRGVIAHVQEAEHLSPAEAYDRALSGGSEAREYDTLTDLLFERVPFRGAGVREHLIFVLASLYCWVQDPDLGSLPNPWEPLLRLYRLGYTSSFETDEDEEHVTLTVGYRDGLARYQIA